jgi:hypothetical protein
MSYIFLPDGRRIGTGDRIHAIASERFVAAPIGSFSLAGMQMKVSATRTEPIDVIGTIIHVKGNHPTDPDRIWVYLTVESENPPLAKEPCDSKHPGEMESVFEWASYIDITILPPKEG